MKYCLLLCGILMSFAGRAQYKTAEQDLQLSLNYSNISKETVPVPDNNFNVVSKTGYATYYAKKFEGRKTTSGAKYRGRKLTAAHLTLPFGTIVTVTNISNGKSVDVTVNDRGPHSRKYMIDLSESAAKELGFYKKGQSKVEISYHLD